MQTKKLAFIQPNIDDGNLIPPLGVLIMAALMEAEGWEVAFFDERVNSNVIKDVIDFAPAIIGITAVTASVLRGRELAELIKATLPESIVVFGGPHPTAMPEEVVRWDAVDFVVIGEGERTICALGEWVIGGMLDDALRDIPNVCYVEENHVIHNTLIPFLESKELDSLPYPAFHLLDLEKVFKYNRHGLFKKGNRVLPIMSSRGCPQLCTYCCRVMGRRMRCRTVESLIHEMDHLINVFNVNEIWFEDDNFTANKVWANAVLDAIIEKDYGIPIKFANGIRADGVDEGLLRKMKRAGCYAISFGIESGSPHVLDLMQKKLSLDKSIENIMIAKKLGYLVGSNMILGYPGETLADIEESIAFFMGLDLDSMAAVNLIPFPGTVARDICEEKGYLTEEAKDWNNYIFDIKTPRILIETELVDRHTLINKLNKVYRKMYFKPGRLLKLFRHMTVSDFVAGIKIMSTKIIPK